MKALWNKREALRQIAETEPVSTINGLTRPELYVLVEVSSDIYMPEKRRRRLFSEKRGGTGGADRFRIFSRHPSLGQRGLIERREDANP